jgi:hypothetical protein
MTVIAMQSPWPATIGRTEKPAASGNALPPTQTVPAMPDQSSKGTTADKHAFRDRARESFALPKRGLQSGKEDKSPAPQPFPELRFADPLPNLPELDLPAKARAYQSALTVLRGEDHA